MSELESFAALNEVVRIIQNTSNDRSARLLGEEFMDQDPAAFSKLSWKPRSTMDRVMNVAAFAAWKFGPSAAVVGINLLIGAGAGICIYKNVRDRE